MKRLSLPRIARVLTATSFGLTALCWPTAHASVNVATGAMRCSVSSRQPTLSLSQRLGGSVVVTCNTATTIGVAITVVELDGVTEDRTLEVPLQVRWVTVAANTPVVVTTTRVNCVSTEVGGEEFATRARLNVSGILSGWDRSVPVTDAYAC